MWGLGWNGESYLESHALLWCRSALGPGNRHACGSETSDLNLLLNAHPLLPGLNLHGTAF